MGQSVALGYRHGHLHHHTCYHQSDWDSFGPCCSLRAVHREPDELLDKALSRHYGGDLRHGVLLSVPWRHAGHHPAIAGRYAFHLAGSWRWIYVVGAIVALYFNVFVLVVQSFLKVSALHALAPKGSEPPFAIVQGIVLVLFILAGIKAVRRFYPVT